MPDINNGQNNKKLSIEEVHRIKQLPIKEFNIGNKVQKGFFDSEAHKLYFIDKDGNLNGKVGNIQHYPTNQAASTSQEPERPLKKGVLDRLIKRKSVPKNENTEADVISKAQPKKKKQITYILAFAAAIIMIIALLPKCMSGSASNNSTITVNSNAEVVSVITVKKDIAYGERITTDNIAATNITIDMYNLMSLSSNSDAQPYLWSESDVLVNEDCYAVDYIPNGGILTFGNISSVPPQSVNPWLESTDEYVYVLAPLDDEAVSNAAINFGTIVDVNITRYTSTSNVSDTDNTIDVEGVIHESSNIEANIVDRYWIEKVLVCDILNCEQVSIYGDIFSFTKIPAGRQTIFLSNVLQSEEMRLALSPAYIMLRLTVDQANALGNLTADNLTVSFTSVGIDTTSQEKAQFATEAIKISEKINTIIEGYNYAEEENE